MCIYISSLDFFWQWLEVALHAGQEENNSTRRLLRPAPPCSICAMTSIGWINLYLLLSFYRTIVIQLSLCVVAIMAAEKEALVTPLYVK